MIILFPGWTPPEKIRTLSWSGKDIAYDGIPFIYVPDGRLSLACHQGTDHNLKTNQRHAETKRKQQVDIWYI